MQSESVKSYTDDQISAVSDLATDAQATDRKIQTFYQTIEPIAEDEGDLWVHTGEGNKLYRWDGNDWTPVQDEDIQEALVIAGDAQAIADGKITTYYQDTPPNSIYNSTDFSEYPLGTPSNWSSLWSKISSYEIIEK